MQAMTLIAAGAITGGAIKATLALAGMCFLMWFLARLAKRRLGVGAGTISPNALKIVSKKPLDQRSSLWIVEVGGRHILLGSSLDGGVSKLDDISDAEWEQMSAPVVEGPTPLQAVRRIASAGMGRGGSGDVAAIAGGSADDDDPGALEGTEGPHEQAEEQRFATVGESFQHLLKKARSARSGSRASGDE